MNIPSLQDWLWVEVMCIQAMIGAISLNFRQVSLSFQNDFWILAVTLEKDSIEDREEVSEISTEFSTFLEDIKDKISKVAYTKVLAKVEISTDMPCPHVQGKSTRILFRRKEQGSRG